MEILRAHREAIETTIREEIERLDTFLDKDKLKNQVFQEVMGSIQGRINHNFMIPESLDEILEITKQKTYELIGTKEISSILNTDFVQYISNTFCVLPSPMIKPYESEQKSEHTKVDLANQVETIQIETFNKSIISKYNIIFQNCEFKCEIPNEFNRLEYKKLGFLNCKFHKKVYLNIKCLDDRLIIDNCIFQDSFVLKNATFKDNAYFTNTTFKDYADFSQCEFEKTANFYGAKFEKAPNFSQVQFKGSLNAVNMDLDFGFETLREKIKAEYELSKQQAAPRAGKVLELQFHKSLASIANDFRDSFRIFKNALIKENNNLDASEFHKLELYCKEIELGESPNKRGIQAQSEEDVRKNTKPFKESIDWFLLRFYRKLSEHHTDLLRVLNNLILLIALYAGFIYIGNFTIGDAKTSSISQQLSQNIECLKDSIRESSFIQEYSLSLQLVFIILSILFMAFAIYLVFKLKLLIHIKTTFKIILAGIMKDFWLLLKILSVILSIFCIITFIVLQFETNNRSSILVNIFGFCLFIVLYLWLVCLDSIFLRYIVVIVAYIIASVALGDNIAILSPFLGNLMSDDKSPTDSFFVAITLAYTILTLLVLFSLQKTARRNSIVPS